MPTVKSPEELIARDTGKKDQIVVEKDEAEELPPGWTIEAKKRKTVSAARVDRYYTDPVTGYVFRSLKDAQRYLKTGEVGRLAIKPKNDEYVNTDNKDERLHKDEREERSESKEQMSETLRHKRPRDETRSKFSETNKSELLHRASKRLAGINTDVPPPSPPPPEPKTRQATQLAGIKVDTSQQPSRPYQPEPMTRQAKLLASIRDKASPESLPPPKTRRATRQAGIKVELPPSDTRTSRQARRVRPVNLSASKENNKKTEAEKISVKHNENADMDNKPPVNQEHNKEIEMGPATMLPSEDQAQYTVVPPVNFEKQELPVLNPTVSNPIPQEGYGDMKSNPINFSMKDLWTDPCIEFAVKTLKGAIPFGDLNKPENFSPSPLEVPLEELWSDPCIEFAVKTLTGAIPIGEDDNLLHRPASSRNTWALPDFYRANVGMSFGQSNVLSKQQDSAFGNGGFQKSRFFQ